MTKNQINILIFAIVTAGCGFVGHAVNLFYQPQDTMQSLGVLIWLVSPLAASILLRTLGGDGWKDTGVGLHLISSWRWYMVALLASPFISLIALGLCLLSGGASLTGFSPETVNPFLAVLGLGFAGSAIKNIFEEFSWRGYLTPRLEAIKPNGRFNALITGLIWASWHIPYYLYFLDPVDIKKQSSLSVPAMIILAFIILPLQAYVYGELRLLSRSTWSTWLLHNLSNAVSLALTGGSLILLTRNTASVLFTPGTEGILYTLLMFLLGWALRRYRLKTTGDH
ncbi:MAG: CPBP family intramembrane metalloprotease [Anaerolineae bacterium]|nr:CPBP family intramembrane metalloprotease [Anaerolineae bacterium]